MTDWSNKEEVLEAVREDGYILEILEQASEGLRADKEVVLSAVKKLGDQLRYASEELQADKEVVLAAVKSDNDDALQYASEELRNDREVVLAAVKEWSENIEFASKELRADPEIAITAIECVNSGDEMPAYGIHEVLMKDKKFMLHAITNKAGDYTKNPFILIARAHKDLWKEKEFVLLAIETISNAHSDDKKFYSLRTIDIMDNFTSLGSLLRKIDNSLKSDPEIVLEGAKWDVQAALDFADESLKNNPEFMKEVEQYL